MLLPLLFVHWNPYSFFFHCSITLFRILIFLFALLITKIHRFESEIGRPNSFFVSLIDIYSPSSFSLNRTLFFRFFLFCLIKFFSLSFSAIFFWIICWIKFIYLFIFVNWYIKKIHCPRSYSLLLQHASGD